MSIGKLFEDFVWSTLEKFMLPVCPAAIRLLSMIAAHESGGFQYVKQLGNGPARGLLQMEPVGLAEVERYINLRPEKFRYVDVPDHLDVLIFNAESSLICARVFFMAKPEPLPDADDIEALARYAKKYWNTESGKATWEDYADAYRSYCT